MIVALVAAAWLGSAQAQTVPAPILPGAITVTVSDQSGGVVPGARVTLVGDDEATKKVALAPVLTSGAGTARFEKLALGRYTMQVEFAGFETAVVRDLRIRGGDAKRSVTLAIKKVEEEISVGRDKQSAALDPIGAAFSTVLTRAQIAALPDDPDEMERVLKAMSPPGSTLRVDGFSGGQLPPKSQIRSIRLPRMDMLAAQNHGGMAGAHFIDILTQPGLGPLRGSSDMAFRDDSLNARNPFAAAKGDERLQRYGGSFSGTVVPNRSSFSVSSQGATQYDTTNLLAATPGGTIAAPVRQPMTSGNLTVRFDQATTADHAMRASFQRTSSTRRNRGVGNFDLPDRAYDAAFSDNVFRISENGPIGRRFFGESRLQLRWTDSANASAIDTPTIRVLDAFTSGGAQQKGGRRALEFEAASDIDYVRGRHSARFGVLVEGGTYRSDDSTNYLGTFTFSSLEAFQAGTPQSYTRRIGDPLIRYRNLQVGLYAQDDFRLFKSVMLSYGLRYEAQSLVADQKNFSPRASVTWSPFKSGKTTVRSGMGLFSDWLGTGTYEQTLRVDGQRQREINILNPSYPDPGLTPGTTPPSNKYALAGNLVLPASLSMNAGVDQAITPTLRVTATYTYRRGSSLGRGRNLNALVNGVRPDATLTNFVEVVSDAASRSHSLNIGANLMRLEWHRTFFAANYTYARNENNTSGAFALPANDELASEWGPIAPRHRLAGMLNISPFRNLDTSVNFTAQSGAPYNVTTGLDENNDGVVSDRPVGVGRNSGVAPATWDVGVRVSYAIPFGPRAQTGAPSGGTVIMIGGGGAGGGMPGGMGGGASDRRFRVDLFVSAQNLTNHANYIGVSGVMTSPFFGQATNVANPRKVELGMRFTF